MDVPRFKHAACALLLAILAQGSNATTREDLLNWVAQPSPEVLPDAGRVLRAEDGAVISSLQPPGYAEEFLFPDVDMEIQATANIEAHVSFTEATREFAGQATIDGDGALQNYTAGRPFSDEQLKAATRSRRASCWPGTGSTAGSTTDGATTN